MVLVRNGSAYRYLVRNDGAYMDLGKKRLRKWIWEQTTVSMDFVRNSGAFGLGEKWRCIYGHGKKRMCVYGLGKKWHGVYGFGKKRLCQRSE